MTIREQIFEDIRDSVKDEKLAKQATASVCKRLNIISKYQVVYDTDFRRWFLWYFDDEDNDYYEYPNETGYEEDSTDCKERSDCIRIAREIANENKPSQIEILTKDDKIQWTEKFSN